MTDQSMGMSDTGVAAGEGAGPSPELLQSLLEEFSEAFRRALANALTLASGKVPEVTGKGIVQSPGEKLVEGFSDEQIVFETCLTGARDGNLVAVIPAAEGRLLLPLVGAEDTEIASPPAELTEVVNSSFAEACRSLSRGIQCGLVKDRVEKLDRTWFERVFPGKTSGIRIDYEISSPDGAPVKVHVFVSDALPKALATGTRPAVSAGKSEVRSAVFEELAPSLSEGETRNLDLLLDVGLCVRVELGRTSLRIQEILELGPGSVVELDKLAGEPVDLLVNEQLFARGEVVVIDENFGVRVTDIVSPMERIQAMRQEKA